MTAPIRLRVATLNVRNDADRWTERAPLLCAQLAGLAPDVIGIQELRRFPPQVKAIVKGVADASGGRLRYTHRFAPKTGIWRWWEGLAVLSRLPLVASARLGLPGQHRVAQRVTVMVAGGRSVDFYNTHLATGDPAARKDQAERVLEWMGQRPDVPQVLVGDFNSSPASAAYQRLSGRLRSAHLEANGCHAERTVPTPLRRAAASGAGRVLDYIFVNGEVDVHDAALAFDQPAGNDSGLFASDHFGLVATISVR